MYQVRIEKQAHKTLRKLPRNQARLIQAKIDELARDPYASQNIKPLKGTTYFRLRVGDWRVIYELDDNQLIVIVLNIGPRGGVYS